MPEVKASEPREVGIKWFERPPGLPNMHEVLYFTLLVLSSGKKVTELDTWAENVKAQDVAACATVHPGLY